MIIEEIIPRKVWYNSKTERQASIYGAAPHGEGWFIMDTGYYSFRLRDGTINNFGRPRMNMLEAMTIWEAEKVRLPRAYGLAA